MKVERPTSSDESPPRLPMPPPPPQRKKKLPVAVKKEVREEEPISERRKWEKEMYMKQFKRKSLPTPPPPPPPSPGPAREEKIRKKKLPVAVKKEEEERLYAKSEEQIKRSREFYDEFHLLGGEAKHCKKYPRIFTFESENATFRCGLCNKLATQAHINSEGHKYRFEYPSYYGHQNHDDDVPLPRDPETRKKHKESDAEPQIPKGDRDRSHLWKQTILERRLHLGVITTKDFQEQHPLGKDVEPRVMHHDQEYGFGEYIVIRDVESYPEFNGAVAMVTSYEPEHRDYIISFVGQFRRYQFINIWPTKFVTIPTEAVWQALYRKDPKLVRDIEGIDYGPHFLTADTQQKKKNTVRQQIPWE